jgi:hypothetical protein
LTIACTIEAERAQFRAFLKSLLGEGETACDGKTSLTAAEPIPERPRIDSFDHMDAELYRLRVMTDLIWDTATEINYEDRPKTNLLDRVNVLSSITRDLAEDIEQGF